MAKKKKKPETPKIEHYPVYEPTIRVPFPEFADVIEKLSKVDISLEKDVKVSRDTAWAMYEIAMHIKESPGREYYIGVIRKWLNTEPKPPA